MHVCHSGLCVCVFCCSCAAGVRVELHGSSVSGFALTSSNVNINLDIPGADSKLVMNAFVNLAHAGAMLQYS